MAVAVVQERQGDSSISLEGLSVLLPSERHGLHVVMHFICAFPPKNTQNIWREDAGRRFPLKNACVAKGSMIHVEEICG